MSSVNDSMKEDIEIKLLIEGVAMRYGYDFRDYAQASFKRRIKHLLAKNNFPSISDLQHEILKSTDFFNQVLAEITVTTSEMFRDPPVFQALREHVIPVLKTYPAFKVWHAGCSSGEEVYSFAIMLYEAGLIERAVIYATDINPRALANAKEGIYINEDIKKFATNYLESGGTEDFSNYFTTAYGSSKIIPEIKKNILFSEHNLVTDDVFSEVHIILCRNVMIYFDRQLQNRALNLFSRSLIYKGFLCMGSKETPRFLDRSTDFEDVSPAHKIFRKIVRTPQDEVL
jgi:chemotaxis protein methyltransferase CheR